MGVVYGLAAALFFGSADFAVTRATRRMGTLQVLFYVQLLGLLAIAAVTAIAREAPASPSGMWVRMVVIAAVDFAGTLLLYRAFTVGTLAIVSPIASGFAVVTGVLALLTGERPSALVLVGAALLVTGVAVVTRGSGGQERARLRGVPEALGAALGIGVYFWALDDVTPTLGWLWPVLVTRAVMGALAFVALRGLGQQLGRPQDGMGPVLIAAGLLDTAALVAFNLGLESAFTTVTTALTSLYSVVAAFLAWAFLRERLSTGQWTGVGVIVAGVLLVNL